MRLSQSHLVSQSHLISQLGNLSFSFSFFSLRSDCKELDFKDISYLVIVLYQEHKILPSSGQCKECETQLNMEHFEFRPSTNYAFWRCPLCRSKKSLRDGTHLSGVKITLRTYILLCYRVWICYLKNEVLRFWFWLQKREVTIRGHPSMLLITQKKAFKCPK